VSTITCPRCAGLVWVRDFVVAASDPSGDLRVTWAPTLGPMRWTCAGCGYQVKREGLLSWRLDGTLVGQLEPVAAPDHAS